MLCPGHCPHSPAAQQSPRGPRQHYPPAKKRLWPSGAPDLSLHHGQLGSGTKTSWGRRWRFWTCLVPSSQVPSVSILIGSKARACTHVNMCTYMHTHACVCTIMGAHTYCRWYLFQGPRSLGKKQSQEQVNIFGIPGPRSPDVSILIRAVNNGEGNSLGTSHLPWKA